MPDPTWCAGEVDPGKDWDREEGGGEGEEREGRGGRGEGGRGEGVRRERGRRMG